MDYHKNLNEMHVVIYIIGIYIYISTFLYNYI